MTKKTNTAVATPDAGPGVSRRRFLGYAGAFAGVGMLTLQACNNDDDVPVTPDNRVNLGSNDVGILNYAYALEQLEADFYTRVITESNGKNFFSSAETALLTDVRDHEVAHRDFLKKAITAAGGSVIQNLTPKYPTATFTSRANILETARTFEDLGVAAYNGAGKLIVSGAYLTIAGKIVSVEARHAAYIRDLISNGTFASLETLSAFGSDNGTARDGALMPSAVLPLAQPFITETLNGDNLPK